MDVSHCETLYSSNLYLFSPIIKKRGSCYPIVSPFCQLHGRGDSLTSDMEKGKEIFDLWSWVPVAAGPMWGLRRLPQGLRGLSLPSSGTGRCTWHLPQGIHESFWSWDQRTDRRAASWSRIVEVVSILESIHPHCRRAGSCLTQGSDLSPKVRQ